MTDPTIKNGILATIVLQKMAASRRVTLPAARSGSTGDGLHGAGAADWTADVRAHVGHLVRRGTAPLASLNDIFTRRLTGTPRVS